MHYNTPEMKLESAGILIDLRPIGERDAVARVFTRDFGVLCGVMRAAQIAKKNIPLVGQVGAAAWNARLDTQLGTFHWEAEKNLAAVAMTNMKKLAQMNAAFALIAALLPEREGYSSLYDETLDFLNKLSAPVGADDAYLRWEINFLRELGYALDLSRCASCGEIENLNYLSPRTGRAVCDNCAAPYLDKAYKLPLNLGITMRFISHVCESQGVNVPVARHILIKHN